MSKTIKGYKVFNPDWTCRGFQYKVGETYTHNGKIEICKEGFHFCQRAVDCFKCYAFDSKNKVAEIEALGDIKTEDIKSVTNKIRIVREIEWQELLTIVNTGKNCTGLNNSGNRNSGNYNSGYYNSGDYNSGDWNSTDYSTGFFNSKEQPIYMFNKPVDMNRKDIYNLRGIRILNDAFKPAEWVKVDDMTQEEKTEHPEYETTKGYLKTKDFKTAYKTMWSELTDDEKEAVMQLPNFDAEVFEEITGINVKE